MLINKLKNCEIKLEAIRLYTAFTAKIFSDLPEQKSADNGHQQTTRLTTTTNTQPYIIFNYSSNIIQ